MSPIYLHKTKLLQRINRLRGQLDAVERAVSTGEECSDTLMLLASVKGGVNGLMAGILEDHIHIYLHDCASGKPAAHLSEDLIDLIRAYLK